MDVSITDTRARLRTMAIPYTFDACLPAYTVRKDLYMGGAAIIDNFLTATDYGALTVDHQDPQPGGTIDRNSSL